MCHQLSSHDIPGIAIWVYLIIVNNVSGDDRIATNVTFELDGDSTQTYQHQPDASEAAFIYNVAAYGATNLSNAPHTLVMTNGLGDQVSLLLFDWAQYM